METRERVKSLPIYPYLDEIARALGEGNILLMAATGTGKTTLVPIHLWKLGNYPKKIIMLEPRRVAARAAASFMAGLLGETPGETVGYRTKTDTCVSKATRIEIVTDGVFTRIIQNDPELRDYSVVIFDEFHERSLQNDLGFVLALESQEYFRPELKMLLMSATPDESFLKNCNNFRLLEVPGKTFPVALDYLPPMYGEKFEETAARGIRRLLNNVSGDILVFLPGVSEIERTRRTLGNIKGVEVLPLHGLLSKEEQDQVMREGRTRRVILATSIAESSLTVPGVRHVVDSGLSRIAVFDPATCFDKLETRFASLGSLKQRMGRAGRLGEGVCLRLFDPRGEKERPLYPEPEVLISDLTSLYLTLAVWGENDPLNLKWPAKPDGKRLDQAKSLLKELGALDENGRPTAAGREIEKLPCHPRLALMLLKAKKERASDKAALAAAVLENSECFARDGIIDLEALLETRSNAWPAAVSKSYQRLKSLLKTKEEKFGAVSLGRMLSWAFPDRIAQKRADSEGFLLSNGRGAKLSKESGLAKSEYIVAASLERGAADAKIFLAADLAKEDLIKDFSSRFTLEEILRWDSRRRKVVTERQLKLGALVIKREEKNARGEAQARMLLKMLLDEDLRPLNWNKEAESFMLRARCASFYLDDHPSYEFEVLKEEAEKWLLPFIAEINSFEESEAVDLTAALKARMGRSKAAALEKQIPERFLLPCGRSSKINYGDPQRPLLSARIQDLFGMDRNPTIAGGRITLGVELLSPADRPVQVTFDMENFWRNSYPIIRKELKGRYPKHNWPEEPTLADAAKRTKKLL